MSLAELFTDLFTAQHDLESHLEKSLLFTGLSRAELRRIIHKSTVRQFKQHEHIFYEGDPGSALYCILDGTIQILNVRKNKSLTLATLGAKSFFGELALIDTAARSATAVALGDTTLLCLFKQDLDTLTKHYPRTGNKILTNLASILAKRLRAMNERVNA